MFKPGGKKPSFYAQPDRHLALLINDSSTSYG